MLIPILYLKGISTGDFEEALAALVGTDAPGLSASTIARLKEAWNQEYARWQKRDLSSAKRYLYFLGRRHPFRTPGAGGVTWSSCYVFVVFALVW